MCCVGSGTGNIPVTSITVDPRAGTLVVGQSAFPSAIVCPVDATNKCVVWSSSNTAVATVNPDSGLIIARSAGSAIIYATAQDGSGVVGTCSLTVTSPVLAQDITLNKTFLNLYKGDYFQFTASFIPSNTTNKTVYWSSSKPSVVSIDNHTGEVYARNYGEATIYACAEDGSGAGACCYVAVYPPIEPAVADPPVTNGNSMVADPVNSYTGAHMLQNTLMSLFGGQNLTLTAHYNSTRLVSGSLGIGWWHNYEKHVRMSECEAFVYENPASFSKYIADSDCCTRFICTSPDKTGYVLTVNTGSTYPYILNCNWERTEYYDTNGELAKIVDHQGFETQISHSDTLITVTDTVSGKKLYLEKDTCGRIVRVYDDTDRQTTLTYTCDCLTEIRDPNGNALTYTYDNCGRILTGTDSLGVRYFENTYDAFGRVAQQKDGITGSTRSVFAYDDDLRITTDRNGKQSVREYDSNGMLIRYTDPNCNTEYYEYDGRYNVTSQTDGRCNSVCKSYNSFNKPTQIVDKNGNCTYMEYDAAGNVVRITYPPVGDEIPQEAFVYNTRNQLTQHTDVRGTVTLFTYDTNGMPATKKVGSRNATVYSYESGLLKSQTDPMGNITRYGHNALGQVTSITDANGKVTTYEYDAVGNLLRTVDPNGKAIVNTYDGNYQKTSVTDANGNRTQYAYNGNMKNTAVTLPDGHTLRYAYDGEDRVVSITDQANNVTTVTYDDGGREISRRFADGATVQYGYDGAGNVIRETNAKGGVVTKTYDGVGNVLSVTDDAGNTTTYEYNAMNKVTKMTNAVAGTTVYEYSKAGDLLSQTDALGNRITYTYDAFGNRLTATDAKNNVTAYTYDQNNNLLTVRDPLNHVTTYTYNSLNQCVSVTDALNHTVRYGYDALGRRVTVTDAKNNVFTTVYDANGNVLRTEDAKGNPISQSTYNALNLPLTVTDAAGKTTTYTYNALGKVESVTDSMNHRSEYGYNARGLNTSVRDAANGTSTVTYDAMGNVTRLAGPLGGATAYTYDDMGRLTSESTVSGGTVSYTYNELNIRKKLTNARGQIRQFFYDALGRITGYTSPEGAVSYTYDANGNVLTVTDCNGTITRTYDALNRVTSCTDTCGRVLRYEYDAVGNLSKLIYPDNTAVTYAYDANRNLIRVTDWANRVTAYTYDVNNRVVGITKPDGSVTTTAYDNKQRITSTVERTASGAVISGFEYTYDTLGRIVEEKVLSNSTKLCYTYDSLNRVTQKTVKKLADGSVVSSEAFCYDAAGNITGAPDSCFQYDTNNRLTVFNGSSVSYDLDGNMVSDGSGCYSYDSANRMVSTCDHSYTYNAEDVRIRKVTCCTDTSYTYNTNCRLSQLLMTTVNGTVTKYVYGLGLIGQEKAGSFKTYHFDYRGSTVAITNASGAITDTFQYDTYGKLTARTGDTPIIFGYNGRDGVITDDNGLIYMRARYYSPQMRRFINTDIIPGNISDAVTLNRFAYANGNPVSNVDPFGLEAARGHLTVYSGNIWGGETQQDLLYGDLSKNEIISTLPHFAFDIYTKSEDMHIASLMALSDMTSITNPDMQVVLHEMVQHFLSGSGGDFSNDMLTKYVKKHSSTISYMNDFTSAFNDYAKFYKGNVSKFANSKEFKEYLRSRDVLLSKYSYSGLDDTFGGLTMAIHSWTENQIVLTSFTINSDNTYSGNLRFTFEDNFGLDKDDIGVLDYGLIAEFRSWYILQHYDEYNGKYKPFKTVVTIDYPFSGSLE